MGYYKYIDEFINILSPSAMLALLGNILYFQFYNRKISKYGNILNVISHKNDIPFSSIQATISLIYEITTGTKISDKNFISGKGLSSNNIVEKFSYAKYGMIFVNYDKTPINLDCIANYYGDLDNRKKHDDLDKKTYHKLCEHQIVTLTKEPVGHSFICASLNNFDEQSYAYIRKNNNDLSELIDKFGKHITEKYSDACTFKKNPSTDSTYDKDALKK